MNAQQMQQLVAEVLARAMDDTRERTIVQAGAALDGLHQAADVWGQQLTARTQAEERLGEAAQVREAAEAELVLGETHSEGRINGKNEEQRKQQRTLLLAHDAQNGGAYGQAAKAHVQAQLAFDQAALEYSIADQELKAAHARCRMVTALLDALQV